MDNDYKIIVDASADFAFRLVHPDVVFLDGLVFIDNYFYFFLIHSIFSL